MSAAPAVFIDLAPAPVRSVPFDHVVKEGYLEPSLYQALRASFPTCPKGSGPSGHNLYLGEPGLDDLLARSAAWSSFVGAVRSQAYVDACLAQFRDELRRGGCLVDPAQARYVPWIEPREVKEQREVAAPHPEPHELFVRVDLHQAGTGYGRDLHVDHRRRLITALIYFCDADENAMQGGRLFLWPRPTARLSWLARRRVRTITPRHNLAALFACSRRSYHRVEPITRLSGTRDHVQIHISSSVDAWPATGSSRDRR